MKIFSKTKSLNLLITLAFFVFGVLLGVGLERRKSVLDKKEADSESVYLTRSNTEGSLSGVYISDNYGYKLEIPKNWTAKVDRQVGQGTSLKIYSPDLLVENTGSGLPVVGANISVFVKNSNFASFDEYLKDLREADKNMYINPRFVYVDGVKAVQFENGWEGWGTVTVFMKDGREYEVVMTYNNDQKSTQKYLDVYNEMLKTIVFGD